MAKSLEEIKADMSVLYEDLKAGTVDLRVASELANITGKYLKAAQIELAREVFVANRPEQVLIEGEYAER